MGDYMLSLNHARVVGGENAANGVRDCRSGGPYCFDHLHHSGSCDGHLQ